MKREGPEGLLGQASAVIDVTTAFQLQYNHPLCISRGPADRRDPNQMQDLEFVLSWIVNQRSIFLLYFEI